MNDRFEINDLLDAYGVLLTEKQQKIADLYFHEDCSYQEIAEDLGRHVKSIEMEGISRAAVYDAVRKCRVELARYESLLNHVRHAKIRSSLYDRIENITQDEKVLTLIEELRNTETQEVI